jgi:large subunit ribosomal protein L23
MKNLREVIRRPLITERATRLQEAERKFLFEVAAQANKIEIKRAVETVFEVRVATVNTCRVMGKEKRLGRFSGRRPDWKKAIVTLAEGQTIDFFESV